MQSVDYKLSNLSPNTNQFLIICALKTSSSNDKNQIEKSFAFGIPSIAQGNAITG
ncbi:hypothetical protein G7083_11185 [Vibrio sp. HDW18]|uniref:hypothetical protein n=1 Tax=Vibrio sp. HDW18 TaxID=2714948 RepID=UPI00140AE09F|nr:hypothetical protein [Vibrio sp. HDW18]QIL86361.1 hypothetical protein G7083_11185 [Vibrio sp. HDW18]